MSVRTRLSKLETRKGAATVPVKTILVNIVTGDHERGWFHVVPDEITADTGQVWHRAEGETPRAFIDRVESDAVRDLPANRVRLLTVTAGEPGTEAV